MMLGEVMRALEGGGDDETVLSLMGDVVLFARVRSAASAQGQPAAAYVREAIARFLDTASEEEWTSAIGRIQDDPAPGDRLIALAVEQRLRRDEVRCDGAGADGADPSSAASG